MTTAQERADLMSKLGLDAQNKAALGRVLGTGSIGQATETERTVDMHGDDPHPARRDRLGSLDSCHAPWG